MQKDLFIAFLACFMGLAMVSMVEDQLVPGTEFPIINCVVIVCQYFKPALYRGILGLLSSMINNGNSHQIHLHLIWDGRVHSFYHDCIITITHTHDRMKNVKAQ